MEQPIDVQAYLARVESDPRSVPKAASLGLGYVIKMHQTWLPQGLSLGDLVYSLPLAPGEQQRIAISDERETLSVRDLESMTAEEQQSYREQADSSTTAVSQSAFDESARGGSRMYDWPACWHAVWTVVPRSPVTPVGGVRWRVRVQRTSRERLQYWVAVTNETDQDVQVEGRYEVLATV